MNALQRPLALLLSCALVAGPALAQGELDLPDGDFEFPEGDFSDPAVDEAAEEDAVPPDQTDVEPPPRGIPPASEPEEPAADDPGVGESLSLPASEEPAGPQGYAPRPRTPTGGRVEERLVAVPPAQPPAGEDNQTLTWVLTGVGTTLGIAALAGLGVGGALLLVPNLGPQGSITVTPR